MLALAPLEELELCRTEMRRVTEMKMLLETEEGLPLEGLKKIQAGLHKSRIDGAVLQPRELFDIARTLECSRTARSFLSKRRELYPEIWMLAEPLVVDKVLEFNIDRAIDEGGTVKDSASKELREIRRSIADSYESLRKKLATILRGVTDQGFAQEEIITTREGRMVIPVKSESRNRVPGFVHSASASGATVFVEPAETLDLNNDIRNLHFRETREIERILRELTLQVREVADKIGKSMESLGYLDSVQARARYSIEILGNEPGIEEHGPLRLVQARHPVLISHHGLTKTVPLDVELGAAYRTLVISGPNAGGKSVAMKCVGLLVLMAESGMHIPAAAESLVPFLRDVEVDIGDDQSIESDLSTFSSHLEHLREITSTAGAGSLVLIDEIGSGTDPTEGGAIAAAVLESLTEKGALTIATTHQGFLKVFAYETSGMENGAMEFDQESLTPTYRFRAGVPGSSYAFELAGRHGLPAGMIDRARGLLGSPQASMERLLLELEAAAQRYKSKNEELQREKAAVDEQARTYQSRIAQLSAELREMKRQAAEEAGRIVDGAHALVERVVREIREQGADKAAVKKAREEIVQQRGEITETQRALHVETKQVSSRPVEVGARVRIDEGTAVGEVVQLSSDGKVATVALGSVRMKIPVPELSVTDERLPLVSLPESLPGDRGSPVQRELDLRGLTGDEALPLVDKFIDDGLLKGISRLTIIHGKGTGALRKKVTRFLSDDPRVRTSTLAEWNEGGTGATVIYLKEG